MSEIKEIKQDIRSKILKITNKDIVETDVNVLGKPYYLDPRSLVYLFMEVQQDYNIKIPEEKLKNQQFATIDGIASIVISCLNNYH